MIFITADDEPGAREQALRTGCAAYLRKSDLGEAAVQAFRGANHWLPCILDEFSMAEAQSVSVKLDRLVFAPPRAVRGKSGQAPETANPTLR